MRIWEHTFAELTGGIAPLPNSSNPFFEQPFDARTLVPITDRPKFATAMPRAAPSMRDQVLLLREPNGWRCIGHLVDDTITIHPDFEHQGLATELFLRAVEHRDLPLTTNFTQRGYDLVRRAHTLAVERALQDGLNVPPKVLAEYPDLAAKFH